ncbi:MAG: acylphosphatase [Bacteroidota bacterium]
MICYQILIRGDFAHQRFRFRVMEEAYKMGIRGVVQYTTREDIFIEAEGKEEIINAFAEWCEKEVFIRKRVKEITIQELELRNYQAFDILEEKKQLDEQERKREKPVGQNSITRSFFRILNEIKTR